MSPRTTSLIRALTKANPGTTERRLGQIRDELADLDRTDEELRVRIGKLRQA